MSWPGAVVAAAAAVAVAVWPGSPPRIPGSSFHVRRGLLLNWQSPSTPPSLLLVVLLAEGEELLVLLLVVLLAEGQELMVVLLLLVVLLAEGEELLVLLLVVVLVCWVYWD